MNSFVDTNVSIAYIFLIDPLNNKSMAVFREYKTIYWSKCVEDECKKVFKIKRRILVKFYKDLAKDIKPENFHDFKFDDLENYVMRKYSNNKRTNQILSSLKKFWDAYINERFPTFNTFIQAIQNCLNDLKYSINTRKTAWDKYISLIPNRTDEYITLKKKLNSFNVHTPDDDIVLDAHDFNLKNNIHLDFITFDEDCFKGVSIIDEFQFNKVKGKYDYL